MSYMVYDAMEPCVLMERKRVADGAGGFIVQWTEGPEFEAAITFDSSMQARIGESQGVTSLYTVTVPKTAALDYHEVFKRLKDGKIFRVTSDGDDIVTPQRASFQFAQFTAEEWGLTT